MKTDEKILLIRPIKVAISLSCIAGVLIFINLIDQINIYLLGIPVVLIPELHLDESSTLATYFLATLFTLSAIMLGMIGVFTKKMRDPYSIYWMVMAIIFLFVSIDEIVNIHESIKIIFWNYTNSGIRPFFTWIITVIAFVAAFMFIRFLFHLPSTDRSLLLFAAILFLGGAVVLDYFDGRYFSLSGEFTLTYGILTTIESGLELFGSVVFIYALLNHMSRNGINIIVKNKS